MSDYLTEQERTNAKFRRVIKGSFAPQGAGAPTQPTGEALRVVITRTGAGVFRFTLQDRYGRFISAKFQLQKAAVEHCFCITSVPDVNNATLASRFFDVTYLEGAPQVAADIAALALNRIYYTITLSDAPTTVTP